MSEKTQKSTRFGRRMTIAIAALLKCPTVEQAAQVAAIPASTLRRWRAKPEFAQQLLDAQAEILQGTINELRGGGADAAKTLRAIANDPKGAVPGRVRACGLILNLLLRHHEHEVLEARMTAIEAALQRRSEGRSR